MSCEVFPKGKERPDMFIIVQDFKYYGSHE